MKLIVGLGNPGNEYANTRHNVGFMIIDEIAKKVNGEFSDDKKNKCHILKSDDFILIKPKTYMNLSGNSVVEVMNYYKININNLLVICDELDLKVGQAKIRISSSSGGHNGIKDIINKIGSSDFYRLKIGIGRPTNNEKVAQYVLNDFTQEQKPIIDKVIDKAVDAVLSYIYNDINYVVNNFNKKG